MAEPLTVHIIDDDAEVRDSTQLVLETAGYRCAAYPSAMQFLEDPRSRQPGCAVVDIRMPGMDGLALQTEMQARGFHVPIVFMTGFADVPLAVAAMKSGAVDFVEKPCPPATLREAINRALAQVRQDRDRADEADEARRRLARLTPREADVLACLVAGDLNKVAAHKLGISPRTVELHRARIMEKAQVRSLADLVRMAITAGTDA